MTGCARSPVRTPACNSANIQEASREHQAHTRCALCWGACQPCPSPVPREPPGLLGGGSYARESALRGRPLGQVLTSGSFGGRGRVWVLGTVPLSGGADPPPRRPLLRGSGWVHACVQGAAVQGGCTPPWVVLWKDAPPQDWAQRLISSSTAAGRCHLSSQVVATETSSAGPPGSPLPGLEGWRAGSKLEEPQTWFESSSRPAPGLGSREGYLLWTWGGQGTSADEALGTDPLSSCEVPALPPGGTYISQCAQEGRVWRPSAPDREWCVQAAGAQHGAPRGPARICLCHHRVDEPVSGLFPRRAQCGTSWGPGPRRGLLRSTGEARKAGTEPSLSSHVATCRPLDTGRAVCAAWVSVPPSPSAGNRTASPGSTRAGAGGQ